MSAASPVALLMPPVLGPSRVVVLSFRRGTCPMRLRLSTRLTLPGSPLSRSLAVVFFSFLQITQYFIRSVQLLHLFRGIQIRIQIWVVFLRQMLVCKLDHFRIGLLINLQDSVEIVRARHCYFNWSLVSGGEWRLFHRNSLTSMNTWLAFRCPWSRRSHLQAACQPVFDRMPTTSCF